MTPRLLTSLQERIVTSIKAAHGVTQSAIAIAARVHKSTVSRWQNEDEVVEIKVSELADLVAEYGAPAVLGPLAALDGCAVNKSAPAREPALAGVAALGAAAEAIGDLVSATSPTSPGGVAVTPDEWAKLEPGIALLETKLAELRACNPSGQARLKAVGQ